MYFIECSEPEVVHSGTQQTIRNGVVNLAKVFVVSKEDSKNFSSITFTVTEGGVYYWHYTTQEARDEQFENLLATMMTINICS